VKLVKDWLAARKSKKKVDRVVALEVKTRMQLAFATGAVDGALLIVPLLSIEQCESTLVGALAERAAFVEAGATDYNAEHHANLLATYDTLIAALEKRIGVVN